ncbi:hypothetical protein ES332_D08G192200v1 [Gossypium tomentosum]|uniref:Uncharacterized protein n=1 Tax=Gossypium tomentosum TaxID=34277 RepID=A0A5D2JXC6_GOSTO|nr:hypothetical protein ES332_D08G192200v1 [Gossypium tomentosum]
MFVRLVIMLKVPKRPRLLMRGKKLIITTYPMIILPMCLPQQCSRNLCPVELLLLKRNGNQDLKMFLNVLYRQRKSLKFLKMLHGWRLVFLSGDRDCPLKDAIMPNEESCLKRDDPLTAIMAQMDPTEPLKWELKQKPGMSPPRGGFQPDDPNQQIVAEDIFDEYGGFLSGGNIPDLLTNISCKPKKRKSSKKSKHKRNSSPSSWDSDVPNQDGLSSSSDDDEKKSKKKKTKKKKRRNYSGSSSSGGAEFDKHKRQRINKHSYSSEDSDSGRQYRTKESREKRSYTSEGSKSNPEPCGKKNRSKHSYSSADDFDRHYRKGKYKRSYTPEDSDSGRHDSKKKST